MKNMQSCTLGLVFVSFRAAKAYQHPRCNIQCFFQAGCKSLSVGFAAVSHLTLAMTEMFLLLQECSRLCSYRGGITKHPWQRLVFCHWPLWRAQLSWEQRLPQFQIFLGGMSQICHENTSVHHSPTSFHTSQCSEHLMLLSIGRKYWNFSTIKYLTQIC